LGPIPQAASPTWFKEVERAGITWLGPPEALHHRNCISDGPAGAAKRGRGGTPRLHQNGKKTFIEAAIWTMNHP